jgi:hypothetical protein
MSKYGMSKQQSDAIGAAAALLRMHFDDDAADVVEREGASINATIAELAEALASIENDDGRIPATIWDMRNAALEKARVKA